MSQSLKLFYSEISPFRGLWKKVRISSAIVRREGKWISVATRILLSHLGREKSFVLKPTKDFIACETDLSISKLQGFLQEIVTSGTMRIKVGEKLLAVFFKAPDPSNPKSAQQIQFGPRYTTLGHEHDDSFEVGDSQITLSEPSLEYMYKIFNYEQQATVSSYLRSKRPRFKDVRDLLSRLGLPSDLNRQYTGVEVVAPLPFAMYANNSVVTVAGPRSALHKISVTGFFEVGDRTLRLRGSRMSRKPSLRSISGPITWPERSNSGKLFLYFGKHEIGHINVRRWSGSSNWQLSAHEFFDPTHALLKTGLQERKEAEQFETAVVRLLNELQIPAVWYGAKRYGDRPDLFASIQNGHHRWVLLGECTGQKPSDKFTRLLTRRRELTDLLQNEVQIVSVVFTPSTVSGVDKKQAREDGIIIVGADELAMLLGGLKLAWGTENVWQYLNSDLQVPAEFIYA